MLRKIVPTSPICISSAPVVLAAAAAILLFASAPGVATERREVDAAIVFLVDASGSMDAEEMAIARRSHALAMTSPEVLNGIAKGDHGQIAVAYVEFATRPTVKIGWTIIDGFESANLFAETVSTGRAPGPGDMTGLGLALIEADTLLANLPFEASRLVVDIIGDGRSNSGPSPAIGVRTLVARGAIINAMPIMRTPAYADIDRYFAEEVTAGPGHFTLPIKRVTEMPSALRSKIMLELF